MVRNSFDEFNRVVADLKRRPALCWVARNRDLPDARVLGSAE
jgi:hypothetical protein